MPLLQLFCVGSLQLFLTFYLLNTMKNFIYHFDVPIVLLSLGLFLGGGMFVADYITDAQRFAAYQQALETIAKCRSSKTGDVEAIFIDNLCGKVPSPADFGIIQK